MGRREYEGRKANGRQRGGCCDSYGVDLHNGGISTREGGGDDVTSDTANEILKTVPIEVFVAVEAYLNQKERNKNQKERTK